MKKYFVIGNPINHSLSPKLHNYWIKENNIDAIYDKKKIEEKNKRIKNKMSNLETFRLEINDIDSQIFELLNQRHSVVKKIGQYKKENNMPVLDSSREKIIETKI